MSRALVVGIVAAAIGANLVGLATGCSGKVAPAADASTSSTSSSSTSSSGGSSSWGGSTSSSSSGSSGGSSSGCPTSAPIDTSVYPWKPPRIQLGSCTESELASFDAYITANQNATEADWKSSAGMSATCLACVFGEDSGATTWAPLVDISGSLAELNVGGCMEIASGIESCGRAYQAWFDCRYEACADCDSTQYSKCLTNASKGACKKANDAVLSSCGSNVATYEAACQSGSVVFDGPIRAQCIAGLAPDGG